MGEAVHTTALIGLEVQEDHVRQVGGVQHLRDRVPHAVLVAVEAGVDQGRPLAGEEELVEGDAGTGVPRRDPVNVADDLVNPGHRTPTLVLVQPMSM